jgi:hypothetical protein
MYVHSVLFYLSVELEWNRVHCYGGHLLAYAYQPWMIDDDDDDNDDDNDDDDDDDECGIMDGMNDWRKEPRYSEENCPRAALSPTNST